MQPLKEAEKRLADGGAACVLLSDGQFRESREAGIRPLMSWLLADKDALRGAYAADRVVGAAAAYLMVYGGVKAVYAALASQAGARVLARHGVPLEYGRLVPNILNRDKSDLCPMEKRAASFSTPEEAFLGFSELFRPKPE